MQFVLAGVLLAVSAACIALACAPCWGEPPMQPGDLVWVARAFAATSIAAAFGAGLLL